MGLDLYMYVIKKKDCYEKTLFFRELRKKWNRF